MPLYDVWIIGYHRIGYSICEALNVMKAKFIVVDFDPTAIKKLHSKKIPALFGDIADVEFLEDLKFKNTKLVVMTIPAADDQVNMIKHLLHTKSGAIIIANAYHRADASMLYRAGADYVLMPYILGGDWAAGVLKGHKWTKKRFAELREEQKKILALK
jgi:Trk K+ transport system NAD-binding subunit